MREICTSGSMRGRWKRGVGPILGHRQPQGPATRKASLRYRATSLLYSFPTFSVHVVYLGKQLDGLHLFSGFLVLPWGYFARSACHLFASADLLIAVYSSISRSRA